MVVNRVGSKTHTLYIVTGRVVEVSVVKAPSERSDQAVKVPVGPVM